jgi:8-oxo-dGTP pyrophosphatase MutT (NUDIX family)
MAIDRWRRIRSRLLQDCRVFRLNEVEFEREGFPAPDPFYVVDSPDWINVIPLLPDGRVVMIRQYRFGTETETLEIPGGMCDPGEEPAVAASRELLEETGFTAASWTLLGAVHPNPAIQSNTCHTFLADGLTRVAEPNPDPNESFEERLVALDDIPGLIAGGEITHSLVVAAFYLLGSRQAG